MNRIKQTIKSDKGSTAILNMFYSWIDTDTGENITTSIQSYNTDFHQSCWKDATPERRKNPVNSGMDPDKGADTGIFFPSHSQGSFALFEKWGYFPLNDSWILLWKKEAYLGDRYVCECVEFGAAWSDLGGGMSSTEVDCSRCDTPTFVCIAIRMTRQ